MFATRALRQAAQHAERVPSIKFIGKRSVPSTVDHSPQAHPASPTHALPAGFATSQEQSSHNSFHEYRQRAQQHGPLRKTWARNSDGGIGGASASALPSIEATNGLYFDRNDLPAKFRRATWTPEEIEAIESGGASLSA